MPKLFGRRKKKTSKELVHVPAQSAVPVQRTPENSNQLLVLHYPDKVVLQAPDGRDYTMTRDSAFRLGMVMMENSRN